MTDPDFKKLKRKSPIKAFLKRLFIHIQVKQRLDFFQFADAIGLALETEFEHWHRGATFLHLKNLKVHRGLLMTSRDLVFTHDQMDHGIQSFREAGAIYQKVFDILKRDKLDTFRVTCSFARVGPKAFEEAVERICALVTPSDEILDVIGDPTDVGYTFVSNLTGAKKELLYRTNATQGVVC